MEQTIQQANNKTEPDAQLSATVDAQLTHEYLDKIEQHLSFLHMYFKIILTIQIIGAGVLLYYFRHQILG